MRNKTLNAAYSVFVALGIIAILFVSVMLFMMLLRSGMIILG